MRSMPLTNIAPCCSRNTLTSATSRCTASKVLACCLLIAVVLKGVIPWKEYLLPKELDGVLVKVISGQVHPVSRASRSGLIRGAPTADENGQEGWDIGPGCAIALSSSAEDMRFGTLGFLISVYRDGQLLGSYCTTAGHTMMTKTALDEEGAAPPQVTHPCALSTLYFLLQTQCNPTVRQYMCCVASRGVEESEKDVFDLWVREEALADQMPVEHSRIGQLAAVTTSDRLPGQWASMDVGFVKLSIEERTVRLVKTPINLRKPYTSAALQERNFMQELEIVVDLDSALRTYRIRNPERLISNEEMRSLSIGESQSPDLHVYGCGATTGLMRSSLFDMAPIAFNHSHGDAVFNGFALPPHRADPGPAQPGDSGACFYHVISTSPLIVCAHGMQVDQEGQLRILGMCVSATDMHASNSFTCILSSGHPGILHGEAVCRIHKGLGAYGENQIVCVNK